MARARAFEEVGGFRPDVIAAEDDEFCDPRAAAGLEDLDDRCAHGAPRCGHHELQRSGGAGRGARATPMRRLRRCTAAAKSAILCATGGAF